MNNLKEVIYREKEFNAYKMLSKFLVAKDVLFQHYTQIMEPILIPDLYGKTVRVSETVFPSLHNKRMLISKYLNINAPEIFIYENFYYGAETCGLTKPWIEVSSKVLNDFTDKEITFLIAKQISHIYLQHYVTTVHSNQLSKTFDLIENTSGLSLFNIFGTVDVLEKAFQLVFYNWSRETTHTADIYGLLFCGDLKSAISCIIKLIINDLNLCNNIKISEYLKQCDYLKSINGIISFYTKLDESVPYGPLRISEMLKFLSSSPNKQIFVNMKSLQEELNAK